jgi:hypothetical protein
LGLKEGRSSGRKNVLSVQGTGIGKKQKTPIKTNVRGALHAMIKKEQEEKLEMMQSDHKDLVEVGMSSGASSPKSEHKNLAGTLVESRQEQ